MNPMSHRAKPWKGGWLVGLFVCLFVCLFVFFFLVCLVLLKFYLSVCLFCNNYVFFCLFVCLFVHFVNCSLFLNLFLGASPAHVLLVLRSARWSTSLSLEASKRKKKKTRKKGRKKKGNHPGIATTLGINTQAAPRIRVITGRAQVERRCHRVGTID